MAEVNFRTWNPGAALRFERSTGDRPRNWRVAQHDTAPFVAEVEGADPPDLKTLGSIGHEYLDALVKSLPTVGDEALLPCGWHEALGRQRGGDALRWLDVWPPLDGSDAGRPPRIASWNLTRPAPGGGNARSIVLIAAEVVDVRGIVVPVGLDFALRIPMSLESEGPSWTVSIRSMTADLPYPPYVSLTEVAGPREAIFTNESVRHVASTLVDQSGQVAAHLSLREALSYEDLRLIRHQDGRARKDAFELRGKGLGLHRRNHFDLAYAFNVEASLTPTMEIEVVNFEKKPLTACATQEGHAEVFVQDPPSWRDRAAPPGDPGAYDWHKRRPTRSEADLARFREALDVPEELSGPGFAIRNCPRFVRGESTSEPVRKVRLPAGRDLPVRHDDFSAVSAFVHSRSFYSQLGRFCIDPATYVVAAKPELQVFYRSGIVPGPGKDGRAVNARVSILREEGAGMASFAAGRDEIQMHLALGELHRRSRPVPPEPCGTPARPLGIAADARWIWHELGHYLIAARFGRLEFDFVHSVGDALAAVMCDPGSRLADPRGFGDAERDAAISRRLRGYTFPWIFATRRHDRAVHRGWAWCGSLNRSLLEAPSRGPDAVKGYVSEQILSSTLFRLYLILGGATLRADGSPDVAVRERASILTLFLVVEAIRSLAQPPSVAEILESAMEAADTAMTVPLDLTLPGRPADSWTGGRAHKAVRWAFEAQGMFPPDRDFDHNAPGRPPAVDIFLADRRPGTEETSGGPVAHGHGGYAPVSLDWDGARPWQSDAGDLRVRNRGRAPAGAVSVRWWVGVVSGDRSRPDWDLEPNIDWQLGPVQLPDVDGPGPGEERRVVVDFQAALAALPEAASAIVLVEASCAGDRANSDPAALLPTAICGAPPRIPRHLADLVANDNNLALIEPGR